ncbi:hypothetical protein ACQP00_33835 [Dactylosporangium sp. CS-047395]|uniref:hypothetical protein n=1 Tax=Dactylosporangium sp. CS-047395 TaxID=3239936 RepID=UPI003D92AC73
MHLDSAADHLDGVIRLAGMLGALAIGAVLVLTGKATMTEAAAYISSVLVYLGAVGSARDKRAR